MREQPHYSSWCLPEATSNSSSHRALTRGSETESALSRLRVAPSIQMAIGHRGHAEYTNAKGVTVPEELPGSDLVSTISIRDNVFDSQRRRK